MGRQHFPRTGHTGLGGMESPAKGVVGVSFRAHGEASSSNNRAHRPGGDGGSSPGGGRSILQGPWGGIVVQGSGTPPWGDRRSSPGGGRSMLQGSRGVRESPRGGMGVGGVPCRAGGEAVVSLVLAHQPGRVGSPAPGRAVTGGRHQGGRFQQCARATWGVAGPLPVGGRCCVP